MTLTRELLVVLGDPVVEFVAAEPLGPPQPFTQRLSGAGIDVAMQAATAGQATALLTRVGEDAFADWLMQTWDAAGIHLDATRRVSGRNGIRLRGPDSVVDHRDNVPAAGIDPEQCAMVPWDLTRYVFASGTYQALGGGSASAVRTAFEMARGAGAKTIFHPALTSDLWPGGPRAASAAFEELAGLIDVLVIGAPYACGKLLLQPEAEEAVAAALKRGVSDCVVLQPSGTAVYGSLATSGRVSTSDGWGTGSLDRFVASLAGGDTLQAAVSAAT